MTDQVDLANQHADMLLRIALEEQRLRAALAAGHLGAQADWHVLSAAECQAPHCGEPIPDERRRLLPGVRLCVACQTRAERGCAPS